MEDLLAKALGHLPHGPEFRFLDRLLGLDPGKTGVAEYTIREDELFLRGHFPGEPLFPGVLLVEAAAQLAGVVAQSDPHMAPIEGLKLTAIRSAKILGTGRPGEVVRLEATVTVRLENLVHAETRALVKGRVVMTAGIALGGSVGE